MGAALGVRRDGAAETVEIQLLVTVVELKDIAHTLDRLNVLVAVRVHKMEGAWLYGVAI